MMILKNRVISGIISNDIHAPVAQWIRVLGFEPSGRKFESCRVYQRIKIRFDWSFFFGINSIAAKIKVMSIFNAIVLGLIQGVTEFAPVSSSGHLVIFNHLLNAGNAFTFDVLLNFGTLFALIIFYRKRIVSIIQRFFKPQGWVLVVKVIMATIPAVAVGLLMRDQIEVLNGWIWLVIAMQVLVGIPMIIIGRQNKDCDDREMEQSVGWKTSLKIGLMQMLALIPGVSRSGITILTGLRLNLSAARAAEFSFLMAIPVLAGGATKTLLSSEGQEFITNNMATFIVGNIFAFIAGMLVINFLIKWIAKRGLKDFGWYRICLAAVLSCLLIFNII